MSRRILDEVADWFRQTHDMLLWAALLATGLIFAVWWLGSDVSSPVRAAEEAVQEALADPEIRIRDVRRRSAYGIRPYRVGNVLICGLLNGDEDRPVAALVRERGRRVRRAPFGPGDRVERIAVGGGAGSQSRDPFDLLRACALPR